MNRDELKLAVAERARSAGNGSGKSAYAELITELLQPRHITFDVFRQFMSVEIFTPGDQVTRKIRKGRYRARTMVPGANHLTDATIYQSQFTYMFDRLIAGTTMPLWEVQRGELGTLEQIQREVRADLVDAACAKIFNLLTSVWSASNTPNNYVNATSTGLVATSLDTAIENQIEKSGDVRAIVGTRRALFPLYSFAAYREITATGSNTNGVLLMEDVLLERFRTGRVSTYNSIPVIEMPQVLENRLPLINGKLVRDDVVLLIGENAGKIVLFGNPQEQEHTDTSKQPPDYVYHTWQEWGILIDRPEYITVIETA